MSVEAEMIDVAGDDGSDVESMGEGNDKGDTEGAKSVSPPTDGARSINKL